jgi:hypothetical protein
LNKQFYSKEFQLNVPVTAVPEFAVKLYRLLFITKKGPESSTPKPPLPFLIIKLPVEFAIKYLLYAVTYLIPSAAISKRL